MFIKREWKNLDKVMLIVSFLIVCISLCIIGSATHINKGAINYDFVAKQGAAFVVDLMIILFFSRFDYAKLKKYAKPLYILNLLMLVAVMFVGTSALGAQRWIQLGPITLQPSEFSKLIMIICTASILSDRVGQLNTWRQVLPIGLYVGIPFLLVLKQPDLGTSLVFLAITFGMLFVGRIKMSLLRNVFLAGVVLAPVGWHFLKDYQKSRITVFLNPNADPFGAGYHIIQSKIAIGSGGVFGKGYMHGSQAQLEFLPERSTDFIFAVIGEEFGLLGQLLVLTLYGVIIGRALYMAMQSQDTFSRLTVGTIALSFFVYVFVNSGMVSGILPVVGVPLPLISYGGTSMVTLLAGFGILSSLHSHRKLMSS